MKKIYTNDLMPGMILATDIYNYNDQLVMTAGSVLDDKAITKLIFYAIPFARIEDSSVGEEKEERDEVPVSYSERVKGSREFRKFKEKFEANVSEMKEIFEKIIKEGASFEIAKHIVKDVTDLIHSAGEDMQLFDLIHNMRGYDDLTYAHSINVGMICYVLSGWLKMSDEDRQLALTCGLFHDIGKLLIPDQIVRKPSKLTTEEFELMKQHTVEGYRIIQHYPVNSHIKNAVLMHHERYDGSGYPFGLKGKKIDRFARMVAIADVYEATTAPRKYRGALCPFMVIGIFENEGLQKYDTKMIMTFLENIVNTYMLNRVRLNDGREGEIVFINQHILSRPIVNCNGECIDLSKSKELYIEEIV